jgi:hypothetical protein
VSTARIRIERSRRRALPVFARSDSDRPPTYDPA